MQVGDVRWVRPASKGTSGDFHLRSDSPARNAGFTFAGVATDFESKGRPSGAKYDVGPYEYQETPVVPDAFTTVNPPTGSNAEVVINSAIAKEAAKATSARRGTVRLAAGTFRVSHPVKLVSNVNVIGAGRDLTIIAGAGPEVCRSSAEPAFVFGSQVANVLISDLQFRSSATSFSDGGYDDYRNCVWLAESSNVEIARLRFQKFLYGDGVKLRSSNNVSVHDSVFHSAGDDALCYWMSSGEIYNNDFQVAVSAGVRLVNAANVKVHHNTFTWLSGKAAIVFGHSTTNVQVFNNIVHKFSAATKPVGISCDDCTGTWAVKNNVMWDVSVYAQVTVGAGNIFGTTDTSLANWVKKGYGCPLALSLAKDPPTDGAASAYPLLALTMIAIVALL